MSEHDDTTVWQKVRKPRKRVYVDDTGVEHESRRSAPSQGLPYSIVAILTLLPLITVLGSGFTAYVKRGAVIEQMQEDISKLEESTKVQWQRIGEHLTSHD